MQQLSLSFEAGLSQRYMTLRECVASQVYQKGHGRIAGQLDLSPSKLTEKLAGMRSDGKNSGITLDEFEAYLQLGDLTPLYYLVDKYLKDPSITQQEATAKILAFLEAFPALAASAGLSKPQARRKA